MKYITVIKDYLIRLRKKGLTPSEIASAFALGNFISFMPLIGTHTVTAIALASLLRLNTLIIILGTQLSNPLTIPIQLFASAEIGNLILYGSFLEIEFSRNISYLEHYILPLFVGSLVLGAIVAAISYTCVKMCLQKKKRVV